MLRLKDEEERYHSVETRDLHSAQGTAGEANTNVDIRRGKGPEAVWDSLGVYEWEATPHPEWTRATNEARHVARSIVAQGD